MIAPTITFALKLLKTGRPAERADRPAAQAGAPSKNQLFCLGNKWLINKIRVPGALTGSENSELNISLPGTKSNPKIIAPDILLPGIEQGPANAITVFCSLCFPLLSCRIKASKKLRDEGQARPIRSGIGDGKLDLREAC